VSLREKSKQIHLNAIGAKIQIDHWAIDIRQGVCV
jgi:hypothetical protein